MESQNCVPVPWLHHPVLPNAGCQHREHSPHFPPTSTADLSWVGTHRQLSRAGISPSSSTKPLLEREAANVESRCVSGGNRVCRRRGEEAESSLQEQHLSTQPSYTLLIKRLRSRDRLTNRPGLSHILPSFVFTQQEAVSPWRYQETPAGTRLRISSSKTCTAPHRSQRKEPFH